MPRMGVVGRGCNISKRPTLIEDHHEIDIPLEGAGVHVTMWLYEQSRSFNIVAPRLDGRQVRLHGGPNSVQTRSRSSVGGFLCQQPAAVLH